MRLILIDIAIVLAISLALPLPVVAQSARADEIQSIREEIRFLTTRLDALERAEAASDTLPQTAVVASSSALPDPGNFAEDLNRELGIGISDGEVLRAGTPAIPGPLDRLLQPDGIGFQLSSSTDSTSVSLRLARSVSSGIEDTGHYTTYALTASAPVASGSRFSDLGTFDGFVNSSSVRFQFGRYERRFTDPYEHPRFNELFEAVKARCRQRLGMANETCAPDILQSDFVREYALELLPAYLAMGRTSDDARRPVDWSARAFGAEFTIGYRNFEFLTPAPAQRIEEDRVPLGARAYFSWLPDVRRNSLTWAAGYQRTYDNATAGALCPAVPNGTELSCLTGPIGEPTRTNRLIGSFEYRHRIVFPEGALIPGLGLSTQISYDALNNEFGVDVPIYLIAASDGQLTGGLRFGYTSEEDDFVVGIFVGTAFSLRP